MNPQNDKEQNSPVPHSHSPISYFSKDKTFVFIHQKVEKLVAAMYLLTNALDPEEPVKWSLRSIGTELLALNIGLHGSTAKSTYGNEDMFAGKVVEAVSLLEVASMSGLISEMNFTILKREFSTLLASLKGATEKNSLEEMFLSTPTPHVHSEPTPVQPVKDIQREIPKETHVLKQPLKDYGPVAVKKNRRQSIIINLLKRKKDIMVKDISEIVHDCSEKTLQRELSDLVTQGILKKEGERRWTRYSLA